MLADLLLPDVVNLRFDDFTLSESLITFTMSTTQTEAVCPTCSTRFQRVHSGYKRTLADSPVAGWRARLHLRVRRFFCDNPACTRVTFSERLPIVVGPYGRRTKRLAGEQCQVAFEAGGEGGARLLRQLSMPVSPDTLLRLIRRAPEPAVNTPRVLGVDDWAKRKGQSYGTLLVDLERQRPIDMLPDRDAESFAAWLRAHPGVEIISRDRGVEYITGASEGAPQAMPVADRWHLLRNLHDALERFLQSHLACLQAAAESNPAIPGQATRTSTTTPPAEPASSSIETASTNACESHPQGCLDGVAEIDQSLPPTPPPPTEPPLTRAAQDKQARRTRRQARYAAVKALRAQGVGVNAIARQLEMAQATVRKYLEAETCPLYPAGRRSLSQLAPYRDYSQQRWQVGCHNATQLWREICALGFKGSRGLVALWGARERRVLPATSTPPQPGDPSASPPLKKVSPCASSRAVWLLLKSPDDLKPEEQQALERMKQVEEKLADAHALSQTFLRLVRERLAHELSPWLEAVAASKITALKRFAHGLKQDLAAVTAALTLPWSNGQTEGQVNRLKLIKRKMYGRASFDLLRRRVLAST